MFDNKKNRRKKNKLLYYEAYNINLLSFMFSHGSCPIWKPTVRSIRSIRSIRIEKNFHGFFFFL